MVGYLRDTRQEQYQSKTPIKIKTQAMLMIRSSFGFLITTPFCCVNILCSSVSITGFGWMTDIKKPKPAAPRVGPIKALVSKPEKLLTKSSKKIK
ncbi:hypothetical protein JCM12294_47370 [Desulfocicer niacini]